MKMVLLMILRHNFLLARRYRHVAVVEEHAELLARRRRRVGGGGSGGGRRVGAIAERAVGGAIRLLHGTGGEKVGVAATNGRLHVMSMSMAMVAVGQWRRVEGGGGDIGRAAPVT